MKIVYYTARKQGRKTLRQKAVEDWVEQHPDGKVIQLPQSSDYQGLSLTIIGYEELHGGPIVQYR